MRKGVAVLIVLALPLPACTYDEPPACYQNSGKYYDLAVSRQLEKNGIPHTLDADRGVCVSKKQTAALDLASRQVDGYFHEVADLLKDECEERALVEWATREKLSFEIADTTNSDGRPGGRMFLLRSFSRDEAEANKGKLRNEAPKGAHCESVPKK
jgi:hypothetical protein